MIYVDAKLRRLADLFVGGWNGTALGRHCLWPVILTSHGKVYRVNGSRGWAL